MITGPDVVLACPRCGAVGRVPTIEEVDPALAISWTDGFQEIDGVPRQPNLIRCAGCKEFYWLGESKQVGWYAPGIELPAEIAHWADAPTIVALDEQGYFDALEAGMAFDAERELELRVHAWWRSNDRYRYPDRPVTAPVDEERRRANMERLVQLCEQGDHEILLFRAEALRQLGRFEEASDALYGLCSDYTLARTKIAELIAQRSRDLAVLFGPGLPATGAELES